jgi:alpha-glucosidase
LLLLRWLEFGIFTPLMRNHSALGTREQECYQFEKVEDFKHIVEIRYRLIPYLYSEYMKATLNNEMYFRPLAFDYETDPIAIHVEDQLMLGDALMITPIYEQNAVGRYVYLPEEMMKVKVKNGKFILDEKLEKGHHYIDIELNEIVFLIKKNHIIPICEPALSTDKINFNNIDLIGYVEDKVLYNFYLDDGITKDYDSGDNMITIKVENNEVHSNSSSISFRLKTQLSNEI